MLTATEPGGGRVKTIWKYEFDVADRVTLQMPQGAVILPFAHRAGPYGIWLWAEVDTDRPKEPRTVAIVGTGNPIDPALLPYLSYLTSVVASPFVWHVYEIVTDR